VDTAANYGAGHVPGAFLLDTGVDLSTTRNNGIADTISQVPTQAQMDALIQRTGINANTVIVFTTSPGNFNMMNLGRAYFNFRYWGFPKERLRILDGNTSLYGADYALSTTTPAPAVSTYSVCNLRQDSSVDEVRASFEEMFAVAGDDDPATVIADARSADEYNGVIGKTSVGGGAYVAFEGHARTAEFQEYVTLISGGRLLPEADLMAAMEAIGAGPTTTVYSYCRTSWRAAVNFMALDAVLGWPVKIYDGAWIQWGQMATNDSTIDGSLDPGSPWRTDNSDRTESLSYNKGPIDPLGANSYAPHANVINTEDAGAGSAGGGSGAGPGGGTDKPDAPGYN
jgi:3-mercaptopyruvate sulfurtransferase SseA